MAASTVLGKEKLIEKIATNVVLIISFINGRAIGAQRDICHVGQTDGESYLQRSLRS